MECGLTTQDTRRLRGDQIDVFKILNGFENVYCNIRGGGSLGTNEPPLRSRLHN